MLIMDKKMPLDELVHFGVKGMKWGVRNNEPPNPSYTNRMRSNDRREHGARAVRRINKRLNQGETRKRALEREDTRNARQHAAVIGSLFVARILATHGSTPISDFKNFTAKKAATNRSNARVRNSKLGIGSKVTKTPFVKPGRGGVYNITTKK